MAKANTFSNDEIEELVNKVYGYVIPIFYKPQNITESLIKEIKETARQAIRNFMNNNNNQK